MVKHSLRKISHFTLQWELAFNTRAEIFSDAINNSQFISDLESLKYAAIMRRTEYRKMKKAVVDKISSE